MIIGEMMRGYKDYYADEAPFGEVVSAKVH